MVLTTKQYTPTTDLPGIRPLTILQNNRLDGRVVYRAFDRFTWQSRLVISFTPGKKTSRGHTALQQLTILANKRLRYTVQVVMFHVPSWDNRIYLYEPGLYQQFRFPVYSGTGSKLSMVTSLKPIKGLTLEGKVSVIRENEKEKWEAGIQLRLNF